MPHTSCDALPAGICLNKQLFKIWAKQNGFLQVKTFTKKAVTFPVIVKPNSLGSSIGIAKCSNKEELEQAIAVAEMLDDSHIIEKCIEEITEINVSAYRYNGSIYVSECEQPLVKAGDFLDFNEKYLNGATRNMPAQVDEVYTKQARKITEQVYEKLGLSGVIRADFIIDNTQKKLYLNEVNTVPGSLSFYIWAYHGIPFANLIERLVDSAIKSHVATGTGKKHAFESNILKQYKSGNKNSSAKL